MTTALDTRPITAEQPAEPAVPVRPIDVGPGTIAGPGRRWPGALLVLVVAGVSGWAFTSGISTPWPWSDEGATYLALHRSYAELLVLYRGPDAPLVPYYLLVKAWTDTLQSVWPLLSTLTAARLLSAAAGCLGVVLLYALVTRNAGRLAGLLSSLLLVSLPGYDRLAQEGRPYTLLALAAVASWLLWDRWLRPGVQPGLWSAEPKDAPPGNRTRWRALPAGLAYLLSLAALGMIHTFGLFQWPAQLVATLGTKPGRSWRRLGAFGLTCVLFVVAAFLVAGQTLASVSHGTGSLAPDAARVVDLATSATQATSGAFLSTSPAVIAGTLALAIVGVIGNRRTRSFAVAMLVWLVVPLAMELAVAALRTNLFRSRYWVADLPPLAALAGLGLMIVAKAVNGLVVRLFRSVGSWRPVVTGARVVAVSAIVAGALALQVSLQAPEQIHLRGLHGHHGENLAGVRLIVDETRAQYPGLSVGLSSGTASGILGAAWPDLEAQNPLRRFDPSVPTVFTVPSSQAAVRESIRHSQRVLWIFRGSLDAAAAADVIPHGLAGLRMRVQWAVPAGSDWTAILLKPEVPIPAAAAPG
ncbi:MAG: hypothetical protein WAL91_05985 [Propionicimonas sp.]